MTSGVGPPQTLLLVEDNPGDAELMRDLLEDPLGRRNQVTLAGTLAAALDALGREPFDAVLLDLGLPDATGRTGVEAIRRAHADTPVVVLTGLDDAAVALDCLAAGAQDYLEKSGAAADSLRRAVAYAIARQKEHRAEIRADELQTRLAKIVEASPDAIISLSMDGVVESWNAGAERILGYASEEAVGRHVTEVFRLPEGESSAEQATLLSNALDDTIHEWPETIRLRKDGSRVVLWPTTYVLRRADGETIGLAAIVRDVTERRRQEDELKRRNEELTVRDRQMRALTSRLNAVREEEQIRISREVHDELGQLLTGVKMDLRWMERHAGDAAGVEARLTETTELVDRTIKTVQRIATELRPSALDALGLAAALRDEARRFEARSGVPVAFEDRGEAEAPSQAATAVFRIFQEILTNVGRHAQATRLDVLLDLTQGRCVLTARDNGVGFAPGVDERTALGLLGMRERAAELGGEVDIETEDDVGTCVTVRIPWE